MSDEKKRTFTRNGLKPPCEKDCPDRKPGCGADCAAWKSYIEKRNAEYANRKRLFDEATATAAGKRRIDAKPANKKRSPKYF